MAHTHTTDENELVELHRQALRRLWRAQRNAVIIPMILLVGLVAYLWVGFNNFFHNKAPVVLSNIVHRSPEYLTPVVTQAGEALKRLTPIYTKAIGDVYQRDLPAYKKLITQQTDTLTAFAKQEQKNIDKRLNTLSATLLANVEQHLAPDLTTADREIFEKTVAQSLYQRLQGEVEANWMTQINDLKALTADIYTVSVTTPAPTAKDRQYIVGVGLELLGRKLQEHAQ